MKFWKEFKAFISKGNILDLAVAVVIGTAFNKIVSSLVNDIIMPLVTWALGANSLAGLSVVLRESVDANGEIVQLTWNYGAFLQAIIDFLIIALTIFIVIKVVARSSNLLKDTGEKLRGATKEEKIKLKEMGINPKDHAAVRVALADLRAKEKSAIAEAEKQKKEEAYKNSTEGLLKEIRDLLKAHNAPQNTAEPTETKDAD